MEVSVTKASDGRTKVRVYNPAPDVFTEQRFRLYPPDYNGSNPIDSVESQGEPLTWEFYIEDYGDRFISPYPNQTEGAFSVACEKRFFVFDDWHEKVKVSQTYPIYYNEWTRPSIDSITYAPSERLLDSAVYVKGKNGVTVSNLSASGKCGAQIVSTKWQIEGIGYSVGDTSEKLKSHGQIPITFTAADSRGFTISRTDYITVYDYYKPYISPVAGNGRIIVDRVDPYGEPVDGGTALRIIAGKRYADIGGLNKCRLTYRTKAGSETWSEYFDLLTENASANDYTNNNVKTLDEHVAYKLELKVSDSFGEWESIIFDLLTEEVYMYRSGTRKSIAFGGHVTKNNAMEVYFGAHFYGGVFVDSADGVSGIVIDSSTEGSTKKFVLTVNDSGTLSVAEYKN